MIGARGEPSSARDASYNRRAMPHNESLPYAATDFSSFTEALSALREFAPETKTAALKAQRRLSLRSRRNPPVRSPSNVSQLGAFPSALRNRASLLTIGCERQIESIRKTWVPSLPHLSVTH